LAEQAKIEDLNVKVYYSAVGCSFPGFQQRFGAAAENILGAGGIPDNAETRAFYKLHKEVTGSDADYWGSPMYYALGQTLTQAFEGAGTIDREAVTEYLKNHTFKTMIGEVDIRTQLLNKYYTAGQWQGGFFPAVAGVGASDSEFKPVKLKTSWG
jgi:branched-chain amino acid transport system substrate-binding protein